MANIHPTAVIEKGAEIAPDAEIGAYAYIGPLVKIGSKTVVHHHATVEGNTTMGANNEVFPYAYIGGKTQDLKYREGQPPLIIGDHNVFREFVTIHCGTAENSPTRIGDHNYFLAYAHVAHECIISHHVLISSQTVLAGHVEVFPYANIGGHVAIHQFCKVGSYAMVAGGSVLTEDLLPYMIAEGNRASVRAFNKVALERNGFSEEQINQIRRAFRIIYFSKLNRTQAFERLAAEESIDPEIRKNLLDFRAISTRGLA